MPRRILINIVCLCSAMVVAAIASAANLTLQLYPLTGEMRLLNSGSTPFQFVFYEIKSPSGGLNGASGVWTSISDTYDASGNGFIDPVNNWTELSSTPTDLAEGALFGLGGALPAYRSIVLGIFGTPTLLRRPALFRQSSKHKE